MFKGCSLVGQVGCYIWEYVEACVSKIKGRLVWASQLETSSLGIELEFKGKNHAATDYG